MSLDCWNLLYAYEYIFHRKIPMQKLHINCIPLNIMVEKDSDRASGCNAFNDIPSPDFICKKVNFISMAQSYKWYSITETYISILQ